ncbi:hypothetical protein QQS21_009419 [Conoideocrella luteorostrata]|uniref:N(6)-L-threonylcarbamoyladenine synthase n=1 Tax=Conoideocrella luteorostrata TaxID=1105319 RepID=A0AAJ0FQF0_9HYPO|nr:hypothetical protein QQS21_009419 [Conoideocrella luteorostrata]
MLRPLYCPPGALLRQPPNKRTLLTLAIESSCDDTAVAILSRTPARTQLLFNERISSDNRAFRGVHPVITVQGHNSSLAPLVQRALLALPEQPASSSAANGRLQQKLDFVSVTRGPGIMANLAVGLNMAKGLAVAWDVPLLAVHHMQAHALTPRLVRALGMGMDMDIDMNIGHHGDRGHGADVAAKHSPEGPKFPFLTLLVSGGHTQLVHSAGLTNHRIIANTGDIAIGNLLDQTARVILPPEILNSSPDVMYGRLLETFAFPDASPSEYAAFFRPATSRLDEINPQPTSHSWTIPLPFRNTRRLAYSFSSIHTQVHRIAAANPAMDMHERRSLARHTMRAAFQHLASRLILALQDKPELLQDAGATPTLVVAGGVASNKFLMHVLRETLRARGFPNMRIIAPPVGFCTDNAAMIAWTGMEMFEAGWRSELGVRPVGRWPMEVDGGDGILGMDGWLRM